MPKVRTTIAVDSEALDVFRHMAEVTGRSLSSTIGDWLSETADAAGVVTQAMQRAKESPARALRELQAYAGQVETTLTGLQRQMHHDLDLEDAAGKAGGDPARGVAPALPAASRRRSKR